MRNRPIVAGVLVLVGAVWIGQGLGLVRGSSFMVDDLRWAAAGAGFVVAGVVLLARGRRGSQPPA
jgi:hypothetical protein